MRISLRIGSEGLRCFKLVNFYESLLEVGEHINYSKIKNFVLWSGVNRVKLAEAIQIEIGLLCVALFWLVFLELLTHDSILLDCREGRQVNVGQGLHVLSCIHLRLIDCRAWRGRSWRVAEKRVEDAKCCSFAGRSTPIIPAASSLASINNLHWRSKYRKWVQKGTWKLVASTLVVDTEKQAIVNDILLHKELAVLRDDLHDLLVVRLADVKPEIWPENV